MAERDALRAPRTESASPASSRRRPGVTALAAATLVLCAAVAGTVLFRPRPVLLWNASPSSPVGLYAVGSPEKISTGGIAIAWAPPDARRLAVLRHYLPATVPLVKRVAATSGALVCASRSRIRIDGRQAALRRRRDASGRPLPWWSGCIRLASGEVLLLSRDPAAFDGRYFGVTGEQEIIGSGMLLWAP